MPMHQQLLKQQGRPRIAALKTRKLHFSVLHAACLAVKISDSQRLHYLVHIKVEINYSYLLMQRWLLVLGLPGSLVLNFWICHTHCQLCHSICYAYAGRCKAHHGQLGMSRNCYDHSPCLALFIDERHTRSSKPVTGEVLAASLKVGA